MCRVKFLRLLLIAGIMLFYVRAVSGQITGNIYNYPNQPLQLYKCYGDTLLLADSTVTDKKGAFTLNLQGLEAEGLYKVTLLRNQWFYILNDGKPAQIKTVYQPNAFYNIATDSLTVIKSEENKRFYEFQHLQQKLNIANYWLLQMMRLYPLPDPFHQQLEDEYFSRHKAMDRFVNVGFENLLGLGMSAKIALAYYQPINPDWKQPDTWRDSIIAAHYFDYFNPADSFYLHTNILPEKMDLYLQLRTNKRDAYGQPIYDEMLVAKAAETFLEHAGANPDSVGGTSFRFCLNYFLKKFNKEHKETTFLYLCDQYLKPKEGDCEAEKDQFNWAREKAGILRNIAIGSIAPDFELSDNLKLSDIQSEYTLLLFWATWCPHCTKEIPEIKKATDKFNIKPQTSNIKLITVAVSLDTDNAQWQKFVTENKLSSFLNFSELKGWKGEVGKKYNVYATPTLFLLNREKNIVAKLKGVEELEQLLKKLIN